MLSVKLKQISWGVLAIEAAAIFFSVLLGFAVSAWREDRKEEDTRVQALESFRAELADNYREVQARLPYHQSVLEGFRTLDSQPVPTSIEGLMEATGFRGPRVVFMQEAALRTADATGALALIDYQTAKGITAIYELQRILKSNQDQLAAAALNPAMFNSADLRGTATALMTYFEIVVEYENALMNGYPEVIAHLDEELGRPGPDPENTLASPDSTGVPSSP